MTEPRDKNWRTSDLIRQYWLVEPDEDLKLDSQSIAPAVQAEWYSYKLGAIATGGANLLPTFDDSWGEGYL